MAIFSAFGRYIFRTFRNKANTMIFRAQRISRRKMSNFTAVFGKNARFHGNFTEGYLLFFEPPKPFTCTDT